jgi:outer membrane protein OmpA-like peptidoglycan-associated protein
MSGGGAKGASRRPSTAARAGTAAAASGSQGTPGTAPADSAASSASASGASANPSGTGAAGASNTDAGAADLSTGGSVAGLEGSAAGGAEGRTGAAGGKTGAAGGKTGAAGGKTGAAAGRGTTTTLGSSGDGTDAGGATAAGVEGDSRIAAIDVPSGQVKVDEEYRPQTLGGVLPLVLGVNEEGRFDFDQYSLRPEVKRVLDQLAEQLKTAEYDRLDIVGYTDRIGTSDYNRRLSELRAYSVAQYLMAKGVPENKIRYEGRGDKDPLTPVGHCQGLAREELITCLQKDRRVVIEASIHRKHATVIQ